MRRIWLLMLTLTAVCAFSGVAASTSMAGRCLRVEEPGTGNWSDSLCTKSLSGGQYIQATPITDLGQHQWCAEVEETGTGNYGDSQCTKKEPNGHFVKVYVQGPFWHVNGTQLKQGIRQVKLQLKGTSFLKTTASGEKLEIACKNAVSEGATIEGQGSFQGQDKGRLAFTQCKFVKPATCEIVEPITTNQTKSYLAFNPNSNQQKFVDVFEPQQGTTFVTLKFGKKLCLTLASAPVSGSAAAEIIPVEKEGQEGLMNFPEEPITSVLHEGEVKKVGLKVLEAATFSGAFGARLETNEPWGVF